MDPYDTNPQPLPAFVGKAPQKQHQYRLNPAWRLAGSNHPFAPFTGNALKWESYVYDDATRCVGVPGLHTASAPDRQGPTRDARFCAGTRA